ncbi:Trehalose utilization [Polystyrenella longa]|uniref:Trehalose utilization n=1 Tax=Polystyrenella longa TaxID=2528007 RepID=A0A518CU85_9PLAN|nr:ThuA domain-containing protein [Polystyrenella longa]QDU82775.1 Trehalose utilization [Polystyrenella longa]
MKRSLFYGTLPVLFVLTLSLFAEAAPKAKVLFVGKQPDHPFATHMYLHTSEMLAKCLKLNGEIETVISDGWPKEASQLEGIDTIVVYSTPAAEFLFDSPFRDQVIEQLDKGVGLVTIHWASSIYEKNLDRLGPVWTSYLGGTWISNVGQHTGKSHLTQLAPDHPISHGWDEYEIYDEYYLNPSITDAATPVLEITANDNPVVVGWAFEREQNDGRSYGTTLGHFYENFQDDAFRKMIVNAILWTAHVDVPKEGAKVDLSEADLALPEKPEE